jgi:hypothetical protein
MKPPMTLWDLLPSARPRAAGRGPARSAPAGSLRATDRGSARPVPATLPRDTTAQRYERMTRQMLREHGVRVRKWRSSMSGVAWQVTYRDGTITRLIESPRPRGPMSAAIFLHEIGHHAIGFYRYKPRCLEEYHAWMFSLDQMQRWGITVTDGVHRRMHESLHYAVQKARRRGLRAIPDELHAYLPPPPRAPRATDRGSARSVLPQPRAGGTEPR